MATSFGKRMTKPRSRRLAAPASLTAAMVLTGANVVLVKAIVAEVPVYLFMLFRFLVSTGALLALVRGEPGPKLSEMRRGQARDLTIMALLGMVGFTALMFEGLKRTSAAEAGIITATLPAVVALMGVAGMRERGYVYGRHFVTEPRSAEGTPARFPSLVAELVALQPEVIVAAAPRFLG